MKKRKIYKISGMHCASCAVNIEKAVKKIEGVSSASVNFPAEKLFIEFNEDKIGHDDFKKIVSRVGNYNLESDEENIHEHDHNHEHDAETGGLKKKLVVGAVLAVLVFIGSVAGWPFWLLLILATPVQFWVGSQFYGGLKSLIRYGSANMDTLISIGTLAAYFYSASVVAFPDFFAKTGARPEVYFDTAAIIIVFILLGRYFEFLMKGRASKAIKKLMELQPKTARVVKDGKETEVPIKELKLGDLIVVRPGEKISVDGEITDGASEIDESMVTGESMPVHKKTGTSVIGGTINKSGIIIFKAKKIGRDTVLSQIIKMVEEAQGSKAPIQRLADFASSYFVPAVIVIAVLTFVVWYVWGPAPALNFSLINFVAVLIIACPCALGLATPIAIMVGSGNASQKGILVKDAPSFEIANKIDTIIFDKTGTVTKGKPAVTDLIEVKDKDKKTILQVAASLAKNSIHPLSKVITEKAEKENVEFLAVNNFKEISGKGIMGELRINNKESRVLLGNEKLMEENNAIIDGDLKERIEKLREQGKTVILLATEEKTDNMIHNSRFIIQGAIALADVIKKESKEAVAMLKKYGLEVWMLTGDNENTARAIANEAGIKNVMAGVLPDKKAEKVKELQDKGKIVAMVGDGINDAPALAQANLGIAMGEGTDIAMESANVTLMRGDLNLVAETISLSKRTLRIIKQNLGWAFGYNIILIPVAAGVLYPFFGILLNPIFAAAAMALSSISVVANSLRLKI